MKVQKCPICGGTGNVPGGFYQLLAGFDLPWTSTSTMEACRSCINGIMYVADDKEEKSPEAPK